MPNGYITRIENEDFLDSVYRALVPETTGDSNRGGANDFHRIDYDEFLEVAATFNTPLSSRIGRASEGKDLTHIWWEQTLAGAQDNPSISGTFLNSGTESNDAANDATRKPVSYSNTMTKQDRTFSITDEMQIISRAGGLVAVGNDEFARQMRYIMQVLLRDQERALLESVENSNVVYITGSSALGASPTKLGTASITVDATGAIQTATLIQGGAGYSSAVTSQTSGVVTQTYNTTAANGPIAPAVLGTLACSTTGGIITAITSVVAAGTGYVASALAEPRRIRGLLGDYKLPQALGLENTPRGWLGQVAASATYLDLAGITINSLDDGSAGSITDILNTAMRGMAELETGEMPTTLYVPSKVLTPLMRAARKQVVINVDLNEMMKQGGAVQGKGGGSTGPHFVAGGAIGVFYCDFGTLDIVWHPMLTCAATSGTTAQIAKSRMMLVNEAAMRMVDYKNEGGFYIETRPKLAPVEARVVAQYFTFKLRALRSQAVLTNFKF